MPILNSWGKCKAPVGRRVWGYDTASGVSLDETASSADLGGSRKYSNESLESRIGERFQVNSSWTWASRYEEIGKLHFKVPI